MIPSFSHSFFSVISQMSVVPFTTLLMLFFVLHLVQYKVNNIVPYLPKHVSTGAPYFRTVYALC